MLITTARLPCAIDEIRKLGKLGHTVIATDTFASSPGGHSRYAAESVVTASPRFDTRQFVAQVASLVRDRRIDLMLPAFEEVFYLAEHRGLFPEPAAFFPSLETLRRLHNKGQLAELAADLGVPVPKSEVVTSNMDLIVATRSREQFFAKPIFSRGGVDIFTNTGPLAAVLRAEDCAVSASQPWIVQDYVEGLDVCTFSIAHHGELTGHAAYIHPRTIEHAGGIVFESVDEPEALDIVRSVVRATSYHGQVSFDLMKTKKGMVLIECNPRPTAGLHMMPAPMLEAALLDEDAKTLRVAKDGVRRKYSAPLLRDMLLHWRNALSDLRYLFSDAREVIAVASDIMPAIYQAISYKQLMRTYEQLHESKLAHKHRRLMAAYFEDVCWNGDDASTPRAPATKQSNGVVAELSTP